MAAPIPTGAHDHDPEYDPNSNIHIHFDLSVFRNGEPVPIPSGVGDSLGADIHTHDDTGLIHVHPQTPLGRFVTVGDWFDIWQSDTVAGNPNATFTETELMGQAVDDTNVLKMYVNGVEIDPNPDYQVHDGDSVSLVITSNPIVDFVTSAGTIPIEVLRGEAPVSAANFETYFPLYPGTIFHRAAEDFLGEFVLQGGWLCTVGFDHDAPLGHHQQSHRDR